MKKNYPIILPMLFTITLLSCQDRSSSNDFLFRLISANESGVQFENKLSNKKLNIISYLYYYNGGGVAAGDFNNDGLIDLFFTANEEKNKLYLNKGDLKFDDVTTSAGVAGSGDWSTGVTLVDINNDGYLDIYVCQVSDFKGLKGHNELYINNQNLTFTEMASEYGLDFSGLSTQAVFFDYDNDGDLDMYLLNHSVHSIHSYGSSTLRNEKSDVAGDRLYQNLTERGLKKFQDVTEKAGIYSSHIGYGLGVSVSDVNQDGWLDIYIANDFHENDYLYINNGNGTFSERLEKLIAYTSRYSMGCDIADVDGDGQPDIVSLDMLPADPEILLKSASEDTQEVSDIKAGFGYGPQYVRNCLQINRGDHFIELGQYADVFASDWSWSTLIADFNNDSQAEIFITNGIYKRPNDLDYIQYTADLAAFRYSKDNEDSLESEMIKRLPTLRIPNYMFHQNEGLHFDDVTTQWGLDEPSYSNGVTYADLDNDGDLDIIINNVNQPAFIYENKSNVLLKNNYLQVELRSSKNYLGIGAKLKVYAGGKVFLREMILSRGFQSAVAPIVYVGLGETQIVDSIEVFWRGERCQIERNVEINKRIIITEKDELVQRKESLPQSKIVGFNLSEISLPYKHGENDFKDYLVEPLIPYLLSREGPAVAIGDINGDGLDDMYLGGAKSQAGVLLIQEKNRSFVAQVNSNFSQDLLYEDVDATFSDFNNDGFLDLYVVSGGNEYLEGHYLLEDRLYINDGKGGFIRSKDKLPKLSFNGACVKPADFNGDGFIDLFIGSRSVPGNYGISPDSHILKNDGKGNFNVYQTIKAGMVTDAAWSDFNNDGKLDLIIAGDWMPIMVYENTSTGFYEEKDFPGLKGTHGWWRSLEVKDINSDGWPDIIAGNVGENLKLKPSMNNPVTLLIHDFDANGKIDPVLFYYLGDSNIPFYSKMQLGKQMPMLNKKYLDYSGFSKIKRPEDVFAVKELNTAEWETAQTFETSVFINSLGKKFEKLKIPEDAQFSCVNDILVEDFNNDTFSDILLVGNTNSNSINLGNQNAQGAVLLLGSLSGYTPYPAIRGNDQFLAFNKVKLIKIGSEKYIALTGSNQSVRLYDVQNINP